MTDPVMLLSQAHGDGRITYRALTEAGFSTLAAIAAARTEVLSDRAFLSPATAGRLKAGAKEMLSATGAGVRGEAAVPARSAPSRGERIAGRRSTVELKFSEGVGSVEASLLGQGGPPAVLHHEPPPEEARSSSHDARGTREERAEKPLRDDPQYAAFLPAAAAVTHAAPVSASAAVSAAPAAPAGAPEPIEPPRAMSFWSFGARGRRPS